jgi:DNA uptake protein ComE-like DNA-binding protein
MSLLAMICCIGSGSIPVASEAVPAESTPIATMSAKLDVNVATKEALRKLDGITEARAKAIIEGRCYNATTELVDRKILPNSVYERIKDRLEITPGSKDHGCVRDLPDAAAEINSRAK